MFLWKKDSPSARKHIKLGIALSRPRRRLGTWDTVSEKSGPTPAGGRQCLLAWHLCQRVSSAGFEGAGCMEGQSKRGTDGASLDPVLPSAIDEQGTSPCRVGPPPVATELKQTGLQAGGYFKIVF